MVLGRDYEVVTVNSGDAALAGFHALPQQPDLVLTDVVMPDMSGPMLVEQLRKIEPDLRVLFMSDYDDRLVVQRYVVREGFHLVTKPFLYSELQAAVCGALA